MCQKTLQKYTLSNEKSFSVKFGNTCVMLDHGGEMYQVLMYDVIGIKKELYSDWVCYDMYCTKAESIKEAKKLAKSNKGKYLGIEGEKEILTS